MISGQNSQISSPSGTPPPAAPGRKPGRFALYLSLAVAAVCVSYILKQDNRSIEVISYSSFMSYLDRGEIAAVRILDGSTVELTLKNRGGSGGVEVRKTSIPYEDPGLVPALREKGVSVSGGSSVSIWVRLFAESIPWLMTFLFIWFLFGKNSPTGPGSRVFQFGKSRARRYHEEGNKVTFEDVAGQKDAKYELQEVVAFLKNPQKFTKMGARIPKGVLLVGMPGTGKTLMARAVAGEAGVSYFHMSGSDFVEMFVGVGASRVRDLFEQGRKNAPCIIFIDEIDAVGRTRGAGYGGGHDEREQTLNQLLVEMDGFNSKEGIILLAATNRPDVLDPALLRPGRFDRQVVVAMPDIKEREDILKIHAAKVPLADGVDLARIARATPGMSGADLANMVNEAALYAARRDREKIEMDDFEEARDKILMGVARTALVISDKERRMTAVHEAGHALLHYFLPHADPLHKVTIIPHGRALGMALSLPEQDSYSRTKGWIEDRIVICYGGWAAEKLFYDETTTGAKEDIKQATDLARRMVCEWGMSPALGPVAYGQEEEPIFLGKEIARHKDYSEDTAQRIDKAVTAILDAGKEKACATLTANRDKLDKLTAALIDEETLIDEEVRALLGFPPRG
ncbi:MAG: ATP-dependent zinc metalloprotease FtsH/cell division protease FtsH [Treponematales bacterium]